MLSADISDISYDTADWTARGAGSQTRRHDGGHIVIHRTRYVALHRPRSKDRSTVRLIIDTTGNCTKGCAHARNPGQRYGPCTAVRLYGSATGLSVPPRFLFNVYPRPSASAGPNRTIAKPYASHARRPTKLRPQRIIPPAGTRNTP